MPTVIRVPTLIRKLRVPKQTAQTDYPNRLPIISRAIQSFMTTVPKFVCHVPKLETSFPTYP